MKDLPQFKHVDWINERPPPKFDLAWSNIKPDWSGIIDEKFDMSLLSASSPAGDRRLIEHLSEHYGVDPSRVVLTNGCSEANWLAFMSIVKEGSRVLIEKPVYTPLVEIPRALGARISFIKRRSPSYKFDLSELEDKLKKGCDLFVMQNHNNPTGRALLEEDLSEIASVLDRYGVPVLSDEVYRDFAMTFVDQQPVRAFPSMAEVYHRAISTSSVTKVYGAGSLMGGWMIGPRRYLNKARRLKIYTVPMVNHIANRTVREVLINSHKVLPAYFDEIRLKERLVSQWAAGRKDVQWSSPDGCAVGFLSYEHDENSVEICDRLYREKKVRVIPGEFFHLEKGFRIGLAGDYEVLKGALRAVDELLDRLDEPLK